MIINKIKQKIKYKINNIISKTNWFNEYWGGATKFWNINSFDIDIINLGSNSGLYSFKYSNLPIKGLNLALGPQSLVHDFNILKNYFSCLKPRGYVIISLCPFSCLVSNYNKNQNLKYYTFLHPATINDFDEKERIKALTLKYNMFKEMPLFCIKQTIKEYKNTIFKAKEAGFNFEQHSIDFIKMWKKQFGIDCLDNNLSEKHLSELNIRANILNEMISFCYERDLKPIIVIPPVHKTLSEKFSDKFCENYIYNFIKEGNKSGAPFYNYMFDDRFKKDEYFYNSYFMNENGAEYFTKEFLKEIGLI